MKKILSLLALALVSMASLPTRAATASGNFDVTIALTSQCLFTQTADVAFTYTSFGGAATATPGGFKVQCTNNLPYALTLDGTNSSGTYSYTDAALNLDYTLTINDAAQTGTGLEQTFAVAGSMASGQSGNCATPGGACTNSASANKTRTLTITY
jgi:spore coat protein U-like protein